jgi:hypothetical protein
MPCPQAQRGLGFDQQQAEFLTTALALEERIGRAYAATKLGDLDQLFSDLQRLRWPEGERRLRLGLGRRPSPRSRSSRCCSQWAVVASAHALFFIWPLMFFLFLRSGLMRRCWWGRAPSGPEPYRDY